MLHKYLEYSSCTTVTPITLGYSHGRPQGVAMGALAPPLDFKNFVWGLSENLVIFRLFWVLCWGPFEKYPNNLPTSEKGSVDAHGYN